MRVRIAAATTLAGVLGVLASLAAHAGQTPAPAPRTVLDLGDSLSVGTDPYLRAQLRG